MEQMKRPLVRLTTKLQGGVDTFGMPMVTSYDLDLQSAEGRIKARCQLGRLEDIIFAADGTPITTLERLKELVPPCEVGDTLYEVDIPEYGVITCKVLWLNYYNGPMFHALGNPIVSGWSVHIEVIDGHGKGSTYDFDGKDFGKTVFLTREAAEAAMEGRDG